MTYDIFISYRRKDSAGLTSGTNIARTIKQQLEIEGYKGRVFFDYSELSDDEFEEIILAAIEQCKIFVLILSRDSMMRCANEGDWVRREICHAQKCGLKIIPIEPDNLFNGYPDIFPEELDVVKRIQHTTIHMDSSFERDMRAMIEARIAPILSHQSGDTSPMKGALVRVDSDFECKVLRYGEQIATVGKGLSEFRLPKGKHKISFVGVESDAERYDCIIDIHDLDYEEYVEVKLADQYKTRKAQERLLTEENIRKKAEEKARKEEEERARKEEEERIRKAREHKEKRIAEHKAMQEAAERECIKLGYDLSGKGHNGVYRVGDYYNDGTKEGVVFEIEEGGRHGKIVSLREAYDLKWSILDDKSKTVGSYHKDNGLLNTTNIYLQTPTPRKTWTKMWQTDFPACEWCQRGGADWYLPAIEELKIFTLDKSIRDAINNVLRVKSHWDIECVKRVVFKRDIISDIGETCSYWSSTEHPNSSYSDKYAWCVKIADGKTECDGKYWPKRVRAVARF